MTTAVKERPILFSGPMVRAILEGRKTQTRRICKVQPKREGVWWVLKATSPKNLIRPRGGDVCSEFKTNCIDELKAAMLSLCPHKVGERRWVREKFDIVDDPAAHDQADGQKPKPQRGYEYDCPPCVKRGPDGERWVVDYAANDNTRIIDKAGARRWRPSIHMPRWASRLTLKITDVRVERLQDISDDGIIAEGVQYPVSAEGNPIIRVSGKFPPVAYHRKINLTKGETLSHSELLRCHFASLWDSINGEGSWAANPWVWVVAFRRLEGQRHGESGKKEVARG